MRSKLSTSVLAAVIIGSFTYFTASEAVNIKRHLQEQHSRMKLLKVESVKLDNKLSKTKTVKEQTSQEVQQLEQQTNQFLTERQRLEAELGAQ